MEKVPYLSVVVCAYNIDLYIHECLKSICDSTFKDMEIIVINDGSTDKTGAICDSWAKKDARVHVIHKQNAGIVKARKDGAMAAKGKYITFVDGDDWVDMNLYQNVCDCAIQHNDMLDIVLYEICVQTVGGGLY